MDKDCRRYSGRRVDGYLELIVDGVSDVHGSTMLLVCAGRCLGTGVAVGGNNPIHAFMILFSDMNGKKTLVLPKTLLDY